MKTCKLSSLVLAILLISALFVGLAALPVAAQPNSSVQASAVKHVIFRDDDIAPFHSSPDTLKVVNQVHIDKNVPVTLGVIPHPPDHPSGNELLTDQGTLSYLRSLSMYSLFEFAQHGYTHFDNTQSTVGASSPRMFGAAPYQERLVGADYSEFRGRSYAEQYNSIKQGRDDITQALGVTPTTFIPPWNSGDTNTLKACAALGFTLYSTGEADFGTYDAYMYGIHVQAASLEFGWDTTSDWQTGMATLTHDTDAALNSASAGTDLVILYHYWYFNKADGSPDPARIALFEQYIDHLKSRGDVQFTTLNGGQTLTPSTSAAPAVSSWSAGRLDVFMTGTNSVLYHKWFQDGWFGWESLGGSLTSSPAAVSWSNGRIDVFARGSDGTLQHKWFSGGWSGWESLGGQLASGGPAVSSWAPGRLDVFTTGTDGALKHLWFSVGWHSWESLGGSLTSSPAAVSWSNG
jgi:peptidoglycan/xylan/chitin deacetylase (PgdA/CDA1 family)